MIHKNIFLGLGSNVGDRLANLDNAIEKLNDLPGTTVSACSSVYESAPIGYLTQNDFLNMVARVSTEFSPQQFFKDTQDIEHNLGRTRTIRWGPRTIDIDILFWGDSVISTDSLKIPHPEAETRKFVLVPLNEIAPDFLMPPNGYRVSAILENITDKSNIELYRAKERYVIH